MLLCLCLLAAPLMALAAPGDLTVFTSIPDPDNPDKNLDFYAEDVVRVGETFYARGQDKVYRWQQGMADPELFCELPKYPDAYWETYEQAEPEVQQKLAQVVTNMAGGDGKLWAFNIYAGRIGEITDQGVQWSDVELDMTDMSSAEGPEKRMRQRMVSHFFVSNGVLHFLRDNYSDDSWTDNRVLMRFDMATGAQTQLPTQYAQVICSYKPGQLLTFGVIYDEKSGEPVAAMTALDLASGQETKLPYEMPTDTYNLGGLAYNEATDTIYYTHEKQIWKSTGGEPFTSVAYLTLGYMNQYAPAWVLSDGMYATGAGGLYIRNVDPQYKATRVLRIHGTWEDLAYTRFTSEYPDIPVLLEYNYYGNAEDIAKDITSGNNQTDIFVLHVSQGLRDLIDKGFTADLSDSAVLAQSVASMYPQAQSALCDAEGRPMAYPRSVSFGPWTVNTQLWEEFDMGPMPTTYAQFFDYMLRWQDEFAEDNPDISFLDSSYDGAGLTEVALHSYILQYEEPGKPIDFNSPVLKQVLEQIGKLELKEYDYDNMTDEEWQELDELRSRPAIFTMYSKLGMFYDSNRTRYISSDPKRAAYSETDADQHLLPMVFEEGQTPIMRASMEVLIINPASANIDLAKQYIEFFAQNGMDNYTRYTLSPELNEPVERKDFAQEIKSMQEWHDQSVEQLKTAPESDKRDIQDSIDYVERWLAEQDKNKWELSAGAIAGYRELAPYMNFVENSAFFKQSSGGAMDMLREMLTRYDDGQLSLDAFLRELDSKMRMIVLEGQ